MRILSRYVLGEFRRYLLITLSAFVMLFIVGDFIGRVDNFVEHKARAGDVVRYLLYQLPNIVFLAMPIAVLIATLLALGVLSKNSEVVAMKAGGVPLHRIAAPIFAAAAALCGLILWANETVIPYCNARAEYIKRVKIEKRPQTPALKHDKLWFRGPAGEIVNIGLVDYRGAGTKCYGVTFYKLDGSFRLVERVDAERMVWEDGGWVLEKGTSNSFRGGGIKTAKFDRRPVSLIERPDDFKRIDKLSEEMNISELAGYIAKLRSEGYNPMKYVVDLHGKIAFTMANLIMVIVAVPFSLRTSRSGGMVLGVNIAVLLAISYWFIYSFSVSLGHAGRFPPFFAAWLADMLYGAGGVYLFLHADR